MKHSAGRDRELRPARAVGGPVHRARAQDYPNRPVHILVGFNAGTAADLIARIVASRLGQVLGQQFIVENKPGAGSSSRPKPPRARRRTATRC